MTSATWLSSAAFCISSAALLSNLMLLWLKWPRIIVEITARNGVLPEPDSPQSDQDTDDIVLTVLNNGSEAVTIESVGLAASARAGRHRLDYRDTWHGSQTPALPKAHAAQQPLVMPIRVEGHGCAVFEYTSETMAQLPAGLAYRGYARRYRALRWLPNHPLLHETSSRQSVVRRMSSVHPQVLVGQPNTRREERP